MQRKHIVAAAVLALAGTGAWAQASAPSGAAATAAPAPAAPVSAAKKELVQKVVKLQQPSIEAMARSLAEQPAAAMLQQAGPVLQQRVAADKREAVAKEIQADARKYAEDAGPLVRERALKLAPTTIGPVLEEKLTEDELRQIVATLEMMQSPAVRKFQQLGSEFEKALGDRLVAETRDSIEPKVRALEQSIAKRLGVTPGAAPAGPGPAAAKPPAKK